ncbi:MAG: hypothetical protein FH753_14850 [Firmicutes bacterium]|nr:hypothetical protein [Bacillota bacterium]
MINIMKKLFSEKIFFLVFFLIMIIINMGNFITSFSGFYFLTLVTFLVVFLVQRYVFKEAKKVHMIFFIFIVLTSYYLKLNNINFNYMLLSVLYFLILTIYNSQKNIKKEKYNVLLIILVILVFFIDVFFNYYESKDDIFKDHNLQKEVKEELEKYGYKGEMTKESLKKVTSLYISDKVIDLDGIENLTNLETLRTSILSKNIKNLDNISSLDKLRSLSLHNIKVSKIQSLETIESLEYLELTNIEVDNDKSITNFPNLEDVHIHTPKMNNLSILKDLKHLKNLHIAFTELNSLKGIKNLKNLEKIRFYGSNIKDFSILREIKPGIEFHHRTRVIKDLNGLKHFSNFYIRFNPNFANIVLDRDSKNFWKAEELLK